MTELKAPTWDANLYLKFADHRLRPALDLMGRLDPSNAVRAGHAVYDLGCGAGNITRILAERFATPGCREAPPSDCGRSVAAAHQHRGRVP